jgi:hypothetical protein
VNTPAAPAITTEAILAKCIALVNQKGAGDKERTTAVQCAYELGVAHGKVQGAIDLRNTVFKS